MSSLVLHTARLELRPLDADALDALAAGDAGRLAVLTHARFPAPVGPPPLFGDELPFYATHVRTHPDRVAWTAWVVLRASTREAVGVAGLGGGPDREGHFTLGWSVYPQYQGRGYATEAMGALLGWAFGQPGALRASATIPSRNAPSARVAIKLGMTPVGEVAEALEASASGDGAAAARFVRFELARPG